jgi:hypothetical protein
MREFSAYRLSLEKSPGTIVGHIFLVRSFLPCDFRLRSIASAEVRRRRFWQLPAAQSQEFQAA